MFNRSKKKQSANTAAEEIVSAVPAAPEAPAVSVTESTEISTEIIAVITAAIAAMTGSETAGTGLMIRKISRISGEKITWSNVGLMECIDSRKF